MVAVALLIRGGQLTGGRIAGLESGHAEQLAENVTGRPAETTFIAIFHAEHLAPESTTFQQAMGAALVPLRSDARVLAVTAPRDAPPAIAADMQSRRGARDALAPRHAEAGAPRLPRGARQAPLAGARHHLHREDPVSA